MGRISLALGFAGALAIGAPAWADWHKAYVFDHFEPAMYYGADEGVANPGTDCPLGTMPDNDWKKMLKTAWRTDAQVDEIMNPEHPSRQRDGGYRGPAPDISVYSQPWTLPDPGVFEVTGDTAYGFDLDGDAAGGFTSPDGKTHGIDNAYYRAIGCLSSWRGPPRQGHHASYVMDGMRDGQFAVVMVVSGTGDDWKNDPNAQVAFYTAQDKMVKDANGAIAPDYTFRVNPNALQSVVPARTVNGVIETRGPSFINLRSVDNIPMKIEQGHMRFSIADNGDLTGMIGGYRSVEDMYSELAMGGATFELTMRMNTPAVWYALQRNADYKPNADGKNTFISMAYLYWGKPAYVVMPDAGSEVTVARTITADTEATAQGDAPEKVSQLSASNRQE